MDESAHTPPDRPDASGDAGAPAAPGSPATSGAPTAGTPTAVTPPLPAVTGSAHEVEDDGPEPDLDPDVEARVRTLLAGDADPGPMPTAFSDRIAAALSEEARLRVDPGPLVGTPEHTAPVVALPPRERPRPLYLVAAVAAAAAVVAVGASALHVTKRPNGAAVVGDGITSPPPVATTPAPSSPTSPTGTTGAPGSGGAVHIQLSETAYDAATLAARARALLDTPATPLRDLAAEAPSLGPIATPIGLEACVEALGVTDPAAVSADLATFEGRPAVVVVVTKDGGSTAWAVERSCTTGSPGILAGATPVP